jgi:hypothetical protein
MTAKVPGWFYEKPGSPFIHYCLKIGGGRKIRLSTKLESMALARADKPRFYNEAKAKAADALLPEQQATLITLLDEVRALRADVAVIKAYFGLDQLTPKRPGRRAVTRRRA